MSETQALPEPYEVQKRSTARSDASGAQQGDESASKNAENTFQRRKPAAAECARANSALPQWGGERHAPTAKIRQDKHPDLLLPTSQITPNWEQRDHTGNQGNTKEDR